MTHYSSSPARHVEANLFKPSGKWYSTVMLDMTGEYETATAPQAVENALEKNEMSVAAGWVLVVIEPYNQHKVPVMIVGK